MIIIAKNLTELKQSIVYLTTNCNHKSYPTEFHTYDEAWEELFQSFDHLSGKLGEMRYTQLVDMAKQAKAHYEAYYGTDDTYQRRLGTRLMQDIEQIVDGKPPYAYPEELFRWPKDPARAKPH